MNLKMIYLASPYTFNPPDHIISSRGTEKATQDLKESIKLAVQEDRYDCINQVAGKLQSQYPHAFILPITMSHNTVKYMEAKGTGFDSWKDRDLLYISRCDEVWVVTMGGWEISQGVQEEIKFANDNGIPVKYIDPVTLKDF